MARNTETSITATLKRQWDNLADDIIRENLGKTNEDIVHLLKQQHCAKDAAWVQSRRHLFETK